MRLLLEIAGFDLTLCLKSLAQPDFLGIAGCWMSELCHRSDHARMLIRLIRDRVSDLQVRNVPQLSLTCLRSNSMAVVHVFAESVKRPLRMSNLQF